MTKSPHSTRWLERQRRDPYVSQARKHGFRSRAVYKLIEIDERERLISPGMTVVDLGAAPGGWTQYAAGRVGPNGRVVAIDNLPMSPLNKPNVQILQGDFSESEVLQELRKILPMEGVDLVISDMAPHISGISSVDQPRVIYLAELALQFVQTVLKAEGQFLVKLFQGVGFDDYVRTMRTSFSETKVLKPRASRAKSREVYVVGKGRV